MAFVSVQYARYLAFKCADPNRAVEVMNKALSQTKGSKMLCLSYVNFLKHMEGVIPEIFTKITQVFEKAIEEGDLELSDRSDLAKFYLEYLQENSPTV